MNNTAQVSDLVQYDAGPNVSADHEAVGFEVGHGVAECSVVDEAAALGGERELEIGLAAGLVSFGESSQDKVGQAAAVQALDQAGDRLRVLVVHLHTPRLVDGSYLCSQCSDSMQPAGNGFIAGRSWRRGRELVVTAH